jgi:hypothetical protein
MASLPFGLRDVKIAPLDPDGTPGTMVDLPNSQTMSFTENEDYTELRGDDKVVAKRGNGPTVDWELDNGGISLEAYVIMNGGTLTTSGVTPNVVKTYKKKATDARPDFWAEGQAMSESGGDFHMVLERCKADGGVEGELTDGEFWVTSASGTAIGSVVDDDLYSFVENETVTPIAQPT